MKMNFRWPTLVKTGIVIGVLVVAPFFVPVALVAGLYMFKPRVYLSHAPVSGLCLVLASSVILCCVVWIPSIIMSIADTIVTTDNYYNQHAPSALDAALVMPLID